MKNLLTFDLGRRGRVLAALALAVIALAMLLLGIGSQLPTASASTLPPARPENVIAAITYYLYMPLILHTEPPPVNWVDDFTNKESGWVAAGSGCLGKYDTGSSVYRVTISSGHKNDTCIVWNSKSSFPRVFYGTFVVKAKRTSDSAEMRYGIQFDAAPNSTDKDGTRWVLEVYPKVDTSCKDKPYYWVTAQKDGNSIFWNHEDQEDPYDECTSKIATGKSYNKLGAVRNGRDLNIYIQGTDTGSTYTYHYGSVPRFYSDEAIHTNPSLGYVTLRVVPLSDSTVTVEFDRVEIKSSTTLPPWTD
jgi:hypothetical protein